MITVFLYTLCRVSIVVLVLISFYWMCDFVDTVYVTMVFTNLKCKNGIFMSYFLYSALGRWQKNVDFCHTPVWYYNKTLLKTFLKNSMTLAY
jgi:hypothetical protein